MDARARARDAPCVSVPASSPLVPTPPPDDGAARADRLSDVLKELQLSSATYRSLRLRGDWRLRFDGPLRGVHVVVAGTPHLSVDDGPTHALAPGDLVVLPRADAHTMLSGPRSSAAAISSRTLAERSPDRETVFGPDGEEECRIVCGVFFFTEEDHPAVAGLPSCIHVPADANRRPWLEGLTTALVAEAVERGPGSEVVMARLSDALVTRALRHHAETDEEPGWLHGLRDPAIAQALAVVHGGLRRPWTVAGLAAETGLSRTAFAARFTRLVGQPPMHYVLGCRIRHAKTLLRADRLTIEAVAAQVGYSSAAAFSSAFTRHEGLTPGAYRRRSLP